MVCGVTFSERSAAGSSKVAKRNRGRARSFISHVCTTGAGSRVLGHLETNRIALRRGATRAASVVYYGGIESSLTSCLKTFAMNRRLFWVVVIIAVVSSALLVR